MVCLAPSNEETEAVITIDLLIRGDIKIITASVASNGSLATIYSHNVELLVDTPLAEVTDNEYDVTVLPDGIKDAECFRGSALLVETVKQFRRSGRIITAAYAAPAAVLVPYDIFPTGSMTGSPTLGGKIPAEQWQDKRVVWNARVKLLTSRGPGTAIDFGLKIINLLVGHEKVYEVASQLVMVTGIYNYYE